MAVSILFIGDPHFQVNNINEVDLFLEKITTLATEKQPDLIIIAGDILHTHERLHTIALNKAYDLVNIMRNITKTYVLVGNHDYIQNQQFLTKNHWMNALKEWHNTVIVDEVICETINNQKFVFVPYVSPGRFLEALETSTEKWADAACIFAHQEFFGCKMGAIISVEGDKWPLDNPMVISGHIHSRQMPQKNIYYSGSAMQNAFGESDKNIIAYLVFKNGKYELDEIDLGLPRKKIVYLDVEDIDTYKVKDTADQIKLSITGNYDQFKALKKTKDYQEIIDKGVKVVFKPKKLEKVKKIKQNDAEVEIIDEIKTTSIGFNTILNSIITEEKNKYLMQVYELVINDKDIDPDDIIFL